MNYYKDSGFVRWAREDILTTPDDSAPSELLEWAREEAPLPIGRDATAFLNESVRRWWNAQTDPTELVADIARADRFEGLRAACIACRWIMTDGIHVGGMQIELNYLQTLESVAAERMLLPKNVTSPLSAYLYSLTSLYSGASAPMHSMAVCYIYRSVEQAMFVDGVEYSKEEKQLTRNETISALRTRFRCPPAEFFFKEELLDNGRCPLFSTVPLDKIGITERMEKKADGSSVVYVTATYMTNATMEIK